MSCLRALAFAIPCLLLCGAAPAQEAPSHDLSRASARCAIFAVRRPAQHRQRRDRDPARSQGLPLRHVRRRGVLGRHAPAASRDRGRGERRRRRRAEPDDRARARAQGRCRRAARRDLRRRSAHGTRRPDDPATTLALLKLERGRRRDAASSTSDERLQSVGHHSARCATRRSTTRSRPGSATGSTAGPNRDLERRRDHRARAEPVSRSRTLLGGRSMQHRARRCCAAGARASSTPSCCSTARRSARRQVGRDADSAGLRPRRREPAHVDRLGLGDALERVRREPRDARQGTFFDPRLDDASQVPDRRGERASATCATSPI